MTARRPRRAALVILAVLAAAAAGAWQAGAFSPAASSAAGPRDAPPPATAAVTRQDLTATTPVTATLGYAGSYQVRGPGGGTLTWLPPAGQVIRQGHPVYRTGAETPAVLLYGSVPAWRPLAPGVTGQDVSQLNHDLVALGDADRADVAAAAWDFFSWATAAGVEKLQSHLGAPVPSGWLPLGSVVFAPRALRVSQVTGTLGGPADGPVLTATSDQHVVTVPLDAAAQGEVKAGDQVTVTLPDGTTTPGAVASVGTVATSTGAAGSGPGGNPVIQVQVTLADPRAAGTLDQAPVTVNITTGTARGALVVPVTALVARSPAGYAVEVVAGRGSARRWVPVTPGIFDDASGLVQVTGALTPGQRVVVAPS